MKTVEFLPGLAVEVFSVNNENAFLDIRIVFEEGGGLETREGFAAPGGVPDEAVPIVLVDAIHDGLYGIDLVRPHHQEFLLTLYKHHVAADHLAEHAFSKELLGEFLQVVHFGVVGFSVLVDR